MPNKKFELNSKLDYELTLHGVRSNVKLAFDKFVDIDYLENLDNEDRMLTFYELDSMGRVLIALAEYVALTIDREDKGGGVKC